jgi:hypothetical protein
VKGDKAQIAAQGRIIIIADNPRIEQLEGSCISQNASVSEKRPGGRKHMGIEGVHRVASAEKWLRCGA